MKIIVHSLYENHHCSLCLKLAVEIQVAYSANFGAGNT